MNILEQLEASRAETARLERLVAAATCMEVGHRWKFIGGANAGCCKDCGCSVPVRECEVCKDCDYGDTEEADEIRAACAERHLADATSEEPQP